MPWWQLSIISEQAQVPRLSRLLTEAGAQAVTLCDADTEQMAADQFYEPTLGATPLWTLTRLTGLFPGDVDLRRALEALRARLTAGELRSYHIEVLEDQNWERAWRMHFKPTQFGKRLWVVPSWCIPPVHNAVNVLLDPGMAFGTGTHTTTALCLRWLEATNLEGRDLIDYGCGSGILAIAGLKLGARQAFAVDTDAHALLATQENAQRNGVAGAMQLMFPDAMPGVRVDVLLANILANPLMELAPRFAGLIRPGGSVVLSGVLSDQVDALTRVYKRWFELDRALIFGEWARVVGRRLPVSE